MLFQLEIESNNNTKERMNKIKNDLVTMRFLLLRRNKNEEIKKGNKAAPRYGCLICQATRIEIAK